MLTCLSSPTPTTPPDPVIFFIKAYKEVKQVSVFTPCSSARNQVPVHEQKPSMSGSKGFACSKGEPILIADRACTEAEVTLLWI